MMRLLDWLAAWVAHGIDWRNFGETQDQSLAALGFMKQEIADEHLRLASFAEDWEQPGMDGYDKEAS